MDNEPKTYTKLSALVNDSFTVESVGEYIFKMWSPQESKMLVSNEPQKGYRKIYPVTSDKGQLDLSAGQLGTLLETASYGGKSEIIGKTFSVKSNGKMGIDIRYYFSTIKNKVSQNSPQQEPLPDIPEEWS